MNLSRLVLILAAAFGAAACEKQPLSAPPPAPTPSPVVTSLAPARYQIFFGPHARADTFLVDTQRGRVWVLSKFSDIAGEPTAFDEVDIIDSTGEIGMKLSEFLQLHRAAQATERKGKKQPRTMTLEEFAGKASEPKGGKK